MKSLVALLLFTCVLSSEELPAWILSPTPEDSLGSVGYAAVQKDPRLQKKIALIDAKAKLSEMIKIHIENEIRSSASNNGEKTFESSSIQTSQNLIKNAIVKDEFIDEKGGMYLWLVIRQ
jgi:hypothetical protein